MKRLSVIILLVACLLTSCVGHKHTYSSEWENDAQGHRRVCTTEGCDHAIAYASHSFIKVEDGTGYECSVCGYGKESTPQPDSHTHSFASELISDTTHHWRACASCGEPDVRAEHVWSESQVITPPTSDREGQADRVCLVCGRYSAIMLERLPERMDEETWISAFSFDNLRIKESMKSGAITSSDSVYSIDGNVVEVKSAQTVSYAPRSTISHLDFSSLYSSFSHYGDQVYKADKVSVTMNGSSMAIKDVTAVFKDGRVISVSYSMSLGGLFGTFTYGYSFYDWGEVELSPVRLTDEEAKALVRSEAFECDFNLIYSRIDSSFTIHESNLTVKDSEYLCKYYTDGRLVKTKKGSSVTVAEELSRNIQSIMNFEIINVGDFVYEDGSGQLVYIGPRAEIPGIGTLTSVRITVKDGRMTSFYADIGSYDIYSYEFTYY